MSMNCSHPNPVARGLCASCYGKRRREGTLPDRRNRSAGEWLDISRRDGGECWPWLGPTDQDGYGQAGHVKGHRLAYESIVGEIPEGLTLDHLCGNRACVNPAHLDPVTIRVNVLRSPTGITAVNHRKQFCDHGHEFTASNTYTPPGRPRQRQCRTCKAEWQHRARRAQRLTA